MAGVVQVHDDHGCDWLHGEARTLISRVGQETLLRRACGLHDCMPSCHLLHTATSTTRKTATWVVTIDKYELTMPNKWVYMHVK